MHPERVIVGSETLPQSLYRNWELVKSIPNLIGDFMWTGWDYLGECGIGSIRYQKKATKESVDPGLAILSGAGVIDICGFERPETHWNKQSGAWKKKCDWSRAGEPRRGSSGGVHVESYGCTGELVMGRL